MLDLPVLYTEHDVAEWLGVPVRRVVRQARSGALPSIELPDGERVFDCAELAQWLEEQRAKRGPII